MAPRRRSARLQPQIQPSEEGAGVACHRPQIQPSEDGAGVTRRIRPRMTSPEPAASLPDDDDMLREILLRLPPEPSSLPRASAVCKSWRGLLADPRFLRQFVAHHRKPPLLGVFERSRSLGIVFTPILNPPDRIPPQRFTLGQCSRFPAYDLLDCRHGLVLLSDMSEVVVCDPITGEQRRMAIPLELTGSIVHGAVLCAAGDQGLSSTFKVVLVSPINKPLACVYTSETGIWGNVISTEAPCQVLGKPAALVGNCLYWLCIEDDILVFDLGEDRLTAIRGPPTDGTFLGVGQIIKAEHGAVGYAILVYPRMEMWKLNISGHGVATWVLSKTIEMHAILLLPSRPHDGICAELLGYDEDDAIFISYGESTYMVQLKLMQSRKLDEVHSVEDWYFPFKGFLTPAIAGGFNGAGMLPIG